MKALAAARLLAITAALAIAGCASFNGGGLVPGKSTEADVLALMGEPSQRLSLEGGGSVVYFSRQPYGRTVYAATFGADGILKALEQRLTRKNLATLVPAASTMKEVRALFGPPGQVARYDRMQREVWSYRYYPDYERRIIHVQFDDAGVLREVYDMVDPEEELRKSGRRGR